MHYKIVRQEGEIDELLNKCDDAEREGSKFRGMSYEQGITAAIRWLTETDEEYTMGHPLDD